MRATLGLVAAAALCALAARQAGAEDGTGWYPFEAKSAPEPGAIGMHDWLERPAGKHGRITREGDKLAYNGKPIKLWGLNLC